MKKIYLSLMIVLLAFQFTNAQWTVNGNIIYNSNSGSVGIGTTTPSSLLTLNSNSGANLLLQTNGSNIAGFSVNNNSSIWNGASGISLNLVATTADINFQTGSPAATNMILKNNGFVGIGTTTPEAALTVVNHTPLIQLFDLELNPQDGSSEGKIAFGSSGGAEFASIEAIRTGTAYDDVTQIRFSTSYAIGAGGDGDNIERMRITPQGNLLINQTVQHNPSYKLDVAGNVRANQITVNTSGADFVFEPTYHLIPLSALKIYVDQNHHLPEIASAKEMQTEGLNLGENQTKLLQKVEELTLYIIEQQKQISELKDQVKQIVKQK